MRALLDPVADQRLLVLAAHPDDETLATGGLLQVVLEGGGLVRVVIVTDGERNPWPQHVVERRVVLCDADRIRWGMRRREESLHALADLGIGAGSVAFLGLPDQGLTSILVDRAPSGVDPIVREIEGFRPTVVAMPSPDDLHPDHSALAVLGRLALSRLPAGVRRPIELRYVVHAPRRPASRSDTRYLALSQGQVERKRRAILRHSSQLVLSRRRLLRFAAPVERFDPGSERPSGTHVIRPGRDRGDSFRLEMRQESSALAFGRRTLFLLTDGGDRGVTAYRLPLPKGAPRANLVEAASARVAACVEIEGAGRRRTLIVPRAAFGSPRRIFVKLERRFGFFDEAGWLELPSGARRSAAACDEEPRAWAEPGSVPDDGVCAVIPCYDVGALCGPVIRDVVRRAGHVIAVDDGSRDSTGAELARTARMSGGRMIVHTLPENRGKGVALISAFDLALRTLDFDVLVTLDGDGQHRAADIPRLVHACRSEDADAVIGERDDAGVMPARSRFGNALTRIVLRRLHRGSPSDTQSGFRAFRRRFVEEIVRDVKGRRYETELHILLLALARGRRIRTVPVPTIYLDRNRASHFRPLRDSIRIYRALLGSRATIAGGPSWPE